MLVSIIGGKKMSQFTGQLGVGILGATFMLGATVGVGAALVLTGTIELKPIFTGTVSF
jgi:hypothetical protein